VDPHERAVRPGSGYCTPGLLDRGDGTGRDYSSEVGAAIINHTLLAEQRSAGYI